MITQQLQEYMDMKHIMSTDNKQDFDLIQQQIQGLQIAMEHIKNIPSVLKSTQDNMKEQSLKLDVLLKNTYNIPKLIILLPEVSDKWINKLNPLRIVKNKFRLYFMCAHTYKLASCGTKGKGIKIESYKDWVIKAAPLLKIGLILLKIGLLSAGIPLPLAGISEMFSNDSILSSKYIDSAFQLIQNTADDYTETEFVLDNVNSMLDLDSQKQFNTEQIKSLLKQKHQSLNNTSDQEITRSAYDNMRQFLAVNKVDINDSSVTGLRQVIYRGNVSWILNDDTVEVEYKKSIDGIKYIT